MPAYHSSFNEDLSNYRVIAGCALLPIKTKIRGPAPPCKPDVEDIIDEALNLFRANCFFRNFEIKGPADRILIYLILFTSECLLKLTKTTPLPDALKTLNTLALQNFTVPGESGFSLGAMYPTPSNRTDAELMKQYISQLRQEMAVRLPERIYDADGKPSKWWMCFAKRKFMNKTL